MKTLYTLIGPKGSGKTYIGSLLEKELHIPFLNVETEVWLTIKPNDMSEEYFAKGFSIIEEKVHEQFLHTDQLLIDSIGTHPYFLRFLSHIQSQYRTKFIRVIAPIDRCIERIHKRDESLHVPMSDDEIIKINTQTPLITDYDLEINNTSLTDEAIIKKFEGFF